MLNIALKAVAAVGLHIACKELAKRPATATKPGSNDKRAIAAFGCLVGSAFFAGSCVGDIVNKAIN